MTDGFVAVAPRKLLGELGRGNNHRRHHVQQQSTIGRRNSHARRCTSCKRKRGNFKTIHSSSGDHHDHHHQQQSTSAERYADDRQEEQQQELVLREFSIPAAVLDVTTGALLDPAVYERRVQAECLREGGETASVVRWHVSRVDEETGHAHVEVGEGSFMRC